MPETVYTQVAVRAWDEKLARIAELERQVAFEQEENARLHHEIADIQAENRRWAQRFRALIGGVRESERVLGDFIRATE